MRALMSISVYRVGLASPGIAGPQGEALSVLQKWTGALAALDVDAIVKLYAWVPAARRWWPKTQAIRKSCEGAPDPQAAGRAP